MSISSVKKNTENKIVSETFQSIEDKLLYVLQQTYSVSESFKIMRGILNPRFPLEDLEEMVEEVIPDEDFDSWYDGE